MAAGSRRSIHLCGVALAGACLFFWLGSAIRPDQGSLNITVLSYTSCIGENRSAWLLLSNPSGRPVKLTGGYYREYAPRRGGFRHYSPENPSAAAT